MRRKVQRRCTIMDRKGRLFVHRDLVKMMGLVGGGEIEWYITDEGQAAFRKVGTIL